jgi:hypothetical protein
MFTRDQAVRRLGATTDNCAHASTEQRFVDSVAHGAHDAGQFHAGNVRRPTFGCGVVALSLHEVSGVYSGAPHCDNNVIGSRIGGLAFDELELSLDD